MRAVTAAESVSFGDAFVRAGGNLALQQNVRTLASDIDLVTGGVFLNPGGAQLAPGGTGRWRVWANTWIGEDRGGLVATAPFPNWYGGSFSGGCVSGILVPATGNRFIYVQRPTVTVIADDQVRPFGQPNIR